MAQRLAFPLLPHVKDDQILPLLDEIIIFIEDNRPTLIELRSKMRELGCYDKSTVQPLLEMIQVELRNGHYRLGKFARNILDARDDGKARNEVLFKGLFNTNQILGKYVFEALEQRLHSDAELYRYVTSYAYPGKKLTSPGFKEWLRWMRLLDRIRIIGIRYGLSDAGKEALRFIKMLDVEELLEEDQEEEELLKKKGALKEEPVDVAPDHLPPDRNGELQETGEEPPFADIQGEELPSLGEVGLDGPAHQAVAPPPQSLPAPQEPSGPTIWPTAAPSPSPVAPSPAPAAAQAVVIPAVTPRERVVVSAPPSLEPALRPLRSSVRPMDTSPFTAESVRSNMQRLDQWWEALEDRDVRSAADLGLLPLTWHEDPRQFLLTLACLSQVVVGDTRRGDKVGFLKCLFGAHFFEALVEGPAKAWALLRNLNYFQDNRSQAPFAENLVHFLRIRDVLYPDDAASAAAESSTDLLAAILEAVQGGHGETLIRLLQQELLGGAAVYEPFWILRECVSMGLWTAKALRCYAVVPERQVRWAAYRLGLLPGGPGATTLDDLMGASAAIAEAAGPVVTDFDEPFRHLARHYGCSSPCRNIEGCPFSCREALDL